MSLLLPTALLLLLMLAAAHDHCFGVVNSCRECVARPHCGYCQRSASIGVCVPGNASGPADAAQCSAQTDQFLGAPDVCAAQWCELYTLDSNCSLCAAQHGCAWCTLNSGDCRVRGMPCSGASISRPGLCSLVASRVTASARPLPGIPAAAAGAILGPLAAAALGASAVLAVFACLLARCGLHNVAQLLWGEGKGPDSSESLMSTDLALFVS